MSGKTHTAIFNFLTYCHNSSKHVFCYDLVESSFSKLGITNFDFKNFNNFFASSNKDQHQVASLRQMRMLKITSVATLEIAQPISRKNVIAKSPEI